MPTPIATPSLRPAALSDAPAITELLNAIDRAEIGTPETDLHTIESDLRHPETDLASDSWLGFEGDRLVSYGLLWDESGGERIDIEHCVLPGHQETGQRVLRAMEARALAKARSNGAGRAVIHLGLNTRTTTDTALLTPRGWHPVRRYHTLTRPLDPARDLAPEAPRGVRVRACLTEEDRVRAHALDQLTFVDHYDFQARTYPQWLADLDPELTDWSLVWIVSVDGLGDAGFLLGRGDLSSTAWISGLGVVREARGRGLGGFLLRHAFAEFAARGRARIGLGVDTDNDTGAPELYGRNGMSVHYAVDTWETVVG
ncbi:GNAT family N-acetyltransferase [Streptomyces sp. NPDC093252]|uniref:GNAT family N-acetyltransferase n=1 Tax=Streptomyces sp. NPDC093252 TaxID=3154980 RepID=UPI0034189DAF